MVGVFPTTSIMSTGYGKLVSVWTVLANVSSRYSIWSRETCVPFRQPSRWTDRICRSLATTCRLEHKKEPSSVNLSGRLLWWFARARLLYIGKCGLIPKDHA